MPSLTTHRTTALVLIWAVLLCHGAFGAMHLIPDPVLKPNLAAEHDAAHHPGAHGGTAEELPAHHHADAAYFAVAVGTLLGALYLWSLLLNHRRDGTPSAQRFSGSPPTTVFNLPRGPTLSSLQVLRL